MNINNSITFTKSNSFTNSNTHTNTYTIASTNTNTHTNKPYRETLAVKAFAGNRCQNFVSQGAAYFRWMSFSKMYPSTLSPVGYPSGEKTLNFIKIKNTE